MIMKIIREENMQDTKELHSFIKANKNKIELEYEMNGTSSLIKRKFPKLSKSEIESAVNAVLNI